MACDQRANCTPDGVIPTPLTRSTGAITATAGVVGGAVTVATRVGGWSLESVLATVGPIVFTQGAAVAALAALLTAIALITFISTYVYDRCGTGGAGYPECIEGVVAEIVPSFNSNRDQLFPFTAMHDRADLVVKSRFWPVVESSGAFVFCTRHEPPRRSEILRCYYYEHRVCRAGGGSIGGGVVGGVVAVVAAAFIGAAITCTSIFLCVAALLVAVVVAVVAVLVGAWIGGQAALAGVPDTDPTSSSGMTLAVGDFVTVRGSMARREEDSGANVLWWTTSTSFHGRATPASPRPFSYCDIDDAFVGDCA